MQRFTGILYYLLSLLFFVNHGDTVIVKFLHGDQTSRRFFTLSSDN